MSKEFICLNRSERRFGWLGALMVVATIAIFCCPVNAQYQFVVQPRLQWQATGIQVNDGDCLRILASGIICTHGCGPNAQHDPTGCCPPLPDPCGCTGIAPPDDGYLVPGVMRYSLVGRIGATGAPFYVGPDLQRVFTEEGELSLAFNDNYFPDNSGQFEAVIQPCSAIPTLTEWGLIIFGVVLLGFITWVFLRRRRAAVSCQ